MKDSRVEFPPGQRVKWIEYASPAATPVSAPKPRQGNPQIQKRFFLALGDEF